MPSAAAVPLLSGSIMLPQKVEARLNRDSSRRKACVHQATAKTNQAERQAAMLAQQTVLQKGIDKNEKLADSIEARARAARARLDVIAAEEAKSQLSAATMRKLLAQLQERKAALLQRQTEILEDDSAERGLLSQRLQDHVAAADAQVKRAADADDDKDADADTPLGENRRLRAALLALADEFDAKQATHQATMRVCGAVSSTLEAELGALNSALAPVAAAVAEQKQVRDAIDAFSKKFQGFSMAAAGSKAAIGERAAALDAANVRRREAMLAVREAKAGRTLAKSELGAALERVAPAEMALQSAEARLAKVVALRDALRAKAGGGVEVN